MKVLLVEDENELRKIVRKYLEKSGYIVDEAENGKVALEKFTLVNYDIILLDLNLPLVDGIEVARRIRKESDTPILMLTARSQIYNKLEGFESGADDYLTKPFDMKELLARIVALLKRSSGAIVGLKYLDYDVQPRSNILKRGNEIIELSNKEMGILEYLLVHENIAVSSEELLEHVWDSEVDMLTETVKTHVKTLRKKIDPKKKYITTRSEERRVGKECRSRWSPYH